MTTKKKTSTDAKAKHLADKAEKILLARLAKQRSLGGRPTSYRPTGRSVSTRIKLVESPELTSKNVKSSTISLRVNDKFLEYMNAELEELGVTSKQERNDFLRGAIVAGLANAKRAKSPQWKKFIAAIQKDAKKHLGTSLSLEGPDEIIEAGEIW